MASSLEIIIDQSFTLSFKLIIVNYINKSWCFWLVVWRCSKGRYQWFIWGFKSRASFNQLKYLQYRLLKKLDKEPKDKISF